MKVLIVGYGKMGKEVEKLLLARKHTVTARIDPAGGDFGSLTPEIAGQADAAIEFSLADAVIANAKIYGEAGTNAVVGTTGWISGLDSVKEIVTRKGIGFLFGSNFSLGAHMFFRLVALASRLINPIPEYDIIGYEIHHKRKKDSPSGTANTIARTILENNIRKDTIVDDKLDRAIKPNELHFASLRGGEIPGIHTVILDSEVDSIELTHTVRSRSGLALGAVMACEWLAEKKGFFTIDDCIKDILKYD